MTKATRRRDLLRPRHANQKARVTNIELFFDLVFVFAVTQLSHSLLHSLTLTGAIHTSLLFLAVWWVWIYTSWVTNWLDPERAPVRLLLFALMLAGLILSASLPEAFEAKGLFFAVAYVSMQVGRSAFTLWALGDSSPGNTRNFQRITSWLAFAGIFWIIGAFAEDTARLAWWALALSLEYIAPSLGFWTPGLGRSTTGDWDVEGGHLAERCALFIIIALGESVLVTGAAFAGLAWTPETVGAFVAAFAGSVAMWWIYFDTGAERGTGLIAASEDPGRLGRLVYTYIHLLIVAGIIVSAVADDLVLVHPAGLVKPDALAVILGGPAIYLTGNALFKRAICGRLPLSHLAGLTMLLLLVPVAAKLTPLTLGTATTVILMIAAAWEWNSLRRKPAAPQPEISSR